MNYDEIRLTLRPRTVFEVLDLTLVFFRRHLPSLWPLLLAMALFWAGGMALVSRFHLDMWARVAILALLVLFLRFWMQTLLVLACGRLVFAEHLPWRDVFGDLRSVGWFRMMGRGSFRLLKWSSGFLFLLPLWIVLVRRFFDYEHWLLERLDGPDLSRRLRAFHADSRVVVFRILHAVFLALSMGLGYRVMKISLEAITRSSALSPETPEVWFSLFLLYDPFFIVSRFLFYIQIRTDQEAWDVGILMREGIRRTLNQVLPVILFPAVLLVGVSTSATSLGAEPGHGDADVVSCTPAMKEQPYLRCDPPAYRNYTAEEIEKHMPEEPRHRDAPPDWLKNLGSLGINLFYVGAAIVLVVFLIAIWKRFAGGVRIDEEAEVTGVVAREGLPASMPPELEQVLKAMEEAMERGESREALGLAYVALLLIVAEKGDALTPLELRHLLLVSGELEAALLRAFFMHYLAAFYADEIPPPEPLRPLLHRLSAALLRLRGTHRAGRGPVSV